jgi:hypothetical protein
MGVKHGLSPQGRKWQEAGGNLHNEELHNLQSSPNIIIVRRAEHVAHRKRGEMYLK